MASTGNTPIQLYYSNTAGNIPTSANLIIGELAINVPDGKLFYKDNTGTVSVLASNTTVALAANAYNSLSNYLPLTGGSLSGALTINSNLIVTGNTTLSGNVGIGTTSPMYDLDVNGTANTGALRATSVTANNIVANTITITKTIAPRVLDSTSNSATPTLNTDNYDMMVITGQSVDITSFTTNLTGTPVNGQKLWIAITGTTAIAITWGASFESSTTTLPTTTVTTNRLDVGFVWNVATSKWRCVAST